MRTGRPPRAERQAFTCQQCGATWLMYPWETKSTRSLYCSRECFYKSRVGLKHPTGVATERACAHCGKTFLVGGEGNKKKATIYCSITCARHGYWGESVHKTAREMTEKEAIWLAAILDGEGCIRWTRPKNVTSFALTITNTNRELMDRVMVVAGTGRLTEKVRNPRHSKAFTWQCYGNNARSLLRQMLPTLIVKRDAAKVALGIVEAKTAPLTQRSITMRAADACE